MLDNLATLLCGLSVVCLLVGLYLLGERLYLALGGRSSAFCRGFLEGMEPGGLSLGMTYDGSAESPRSRAYDRGATLGERVGRMLGRG